MSLSSKKIYSYVVTAVLLFSEIALPFAIAAPSDPISSFGITTPGTNIYPNHGIERLDEIVEKVTLCIEKSSYV